MHEMAIADAVVGMVLEQAKGRRVSRVGMRIGQLRQVMPTSLQFGFAMVARETEAEAATLEIVEEPVVVWCERCAAESRPRAFPLVCAQCGDTSVVVKQGEEMLVEWIEMEE